MPMPHLLPIATAAIVAGLLADRSAAAEPKPEADGRWHGDVSIGGSFSSGDNSSQAFNLSADGSRATDVDKTRLYLLINQASGTVDGVRSRTADLYRGGGRYDHDLAERVFAFGGGEAEANRTAGIDRRIGVNAGAGWRLVRGPVHDWNVFAGVGHSNSVYTDGTRLNGVEGVFGEESQHRLGESTTVEQRLAYYPGSGDLGYRATFDASLGVALVGNWIFNAGLSLRYTSSAAPGAEKNERLLTWGFGYKF